mmetsp:Transcript_33806/g.72061  ORF Transcript_33806/g.72061 Transcript_33806/m.72061 type:complete len:134 (-) Transcript_33806:297-698(-)
MSHSPFAPSSKPSGVNEAVEPSSSDSTDKDGAFNVRRSFRSFASALIVAARQAEKVAAASGPDTLATDKTTKETVDMILKQRQSVRRTATILEGKLRGNVKESEALHCFLRSQPCVRGKKRKFTLINHDAAEE